MGERRVVVRKAAQASLVMVSYHIPETRHADWWPIQLMRSVLSDGRSSRLYRRLIDTDQLAVSIEGFTQESLDPGQLIVFSQLRPGASPDKAEQAIYAELTRLRDQGVTADELTKARNQVMAGLFRSLKTINGKASAIGEAEVFHGGYRKLNSLAADLEKITAADLQRVARQYLGNDQRTVGILAPAESRQ